MTDTSYFVCEEVNGLKVCKHHCKDYISAQSFAIVLKDKYPERKITIEVTISITETISETGEEK